jgi:uncharacterized damage-inducible protein DinB
MQLPSQLSAEVLHAWQTNTRVNRLLLAHLTPAMLAAQTPGGGFSVAQHLAHMVGVQKDWCEKLNASAVAALPDLYASGTDDYNTEMQVEFDLVRISAVWAETEATVLASAISSDTKGNLPHVSVGSFLLHMVIHDTHHRGQVLLALKQAGFALPDEDQMWRPWRS